MGESRLSLKYGDGAVEVSLPRSVDLGRGFRRIDPIPLPPEAERCARDPMAALRAALDSPIGTPPLEQMVEPGESCAIAVSDITRLWIGTRHFLPAIVERLNRAGVPDERITLVLARGTHRPNSDAEIAQIVGEELASRLRIVHHDPDGPCTYVGTTSRGTKVEINAEAARCDRLILTGGVVHHAMAGYGGGRKSIVPGIASRATVKSNHLWVIDPEVPMIRDGVGSARTEGNPLHEDMVEAAAMANVDFIVNAATDASGRFAGFFAGHWLEAWRAGCELVDRMYCVPCAGRSDVVLASCGGFPRDISIYQASKAFYNAWMAVKPGGTIVMFCEARDGGGGDEFFSWFDYPTIEECHRALVNDFTVAGYLAFLVYLIAVRHNVVLVTELDEELVRKMHMTRMLPRDAEKALADAVRPSDSVTFMPESAITLPVLE
ncbi:MAG: nickel-dependent lactate racemase [Bacillota bacterium]|jgi:nickel-dependent lactate racemase